MEAGCSFYTSVTSFFCPEDGDKNFPDKSVTSFSYLEDRGSIFLKHVSNDIPDYTEPHPRRLYFL
jgi:hypothetical protein